jgi:hypothetical protein
MNRGSGRSGGAAGRKSSIFIDDPVDDPSLDQGGDGNFGNSNFLLFSDILVSYPLDW